MSYFLYGSEDLKELVNAYENYCDELGVTYYNFDEEKADAAYQRVMEIRARLGVADD